MYNLSTFPRENFLFHHVVEGLEKTSSYESTFVQCLDILYGSGGSCPRNIGIILSSIQIMIFFIISVVLHVEEKSLRTQVHVKEKSLRTQVHVEEKSLRTQVAVNPVNI